MERSLSEKMNEKFSDFEKRISSIERGAGSAGHFGFGASQGGWGPTPTRLKAVIHGFKQDAKGKDVKTLVTKVISGSGTKEEHIVDYPAIPIAHVFVEFKCTRIRHRFVRLVNMRNTNWTKESSRYPRH